MPLPAPLELKPGLRFGRLVILGHIAKSKHSTWLCECDCGTLVTVRGSHLWTNAIRSCGCFARDRARECAPALHERNRKPAIDRFMRKVSPEPNSGCWLWTGASVKAGYGSFAPVGTHSTPAHRYSWVLFRGPIPDGLHIDHLCRVRCCVNPQHLEPVTLQENTRRGIVFRRAQEQTREAL